MRKKVLYPRIKNNKMKLIIYYIPLFLASCFLNAQLSFNSEKPEKSVLLSFSDNGKGLVLPWVNQLPTDTTKGTFVFDTNDKIVKYYNGFEWLPMTSQGQADLQNINKFSETGKGVLITENEVDNLLDLKGVLVLNSDTSALVLPRMDKPYDNLENPSAGTIYYDKTEQIICIFNGENWEFLK